MTLSCCRNKKMYHCHFVATIFLTTICLCLDKSGVLKLFQHTHIGKQKALTSMTKGALLTSLFSSRQNTPSRISLRCSRILIQMLFEETCKRVAFYLMCEGAGWILFSYVWKRSRLDIDPKHLRHYNNITGTVSAHNCIQCSDLALVGISLVKVVCVIPNENSLNYYSSLLG